MMISLWFQVFLTLIILFNNISLLTFIWFHVILFNSNNVKTDLFDLHDTITLGQSRTGSNVSDEVTYTPQIFRTEENVCFGK